MIGQQEAGEFITNPLSGELEIRFPLAQGAVATSGISRRVWQIDGTKTFSHHLLDPATGQPAWTGVIQATAVAGSAQEAEMDGAGRLLIAPELRTFAKLQRDLMLMGVGRHFELWDAATYALDEAKTMDSPMPDSLKSFVF